MVSKKNPPLFFINSKFKAYSFSIFYFICFAIKPSRTKTIFTPPLEFPSLLRGGNWYPSMLNWWLRKLESSFVCQYIAHLFLLSLKSLLNLFILTKCLCWGRQSKDFLICSPEINLTFKIRLKICLMWVIQSEMVIVIIN